jgi:Sulfotransferase domain
VIPPPVAIPLTGRAPLVVDAGDLMRRPADTVRAYCARAGIGFRPQALSWQPSDRPEWLGGFSHWFTGVAASSGLGEVPGRRSLDADQHPLLGTYLAYHLPFYQELYQRRLVVLAARAGADVMPEFLAELILQTGPVGAERGGHGGAQLVSSVSQLDG